VTPHQPRPAIRPPARHQAGALLWWSLGLLVLLAIAPWSWAAGSPKRILLLDSFSQRISTTNTVISTLRTELVRRSPEPIDLHELALEMERLPDASLEVSLIRFLQERFAGREPDLLVCVGGPAYQVLARHREEFFPAVPVLVAGAGEQMLRVGSVPANTAVVPLTIDLAGAVEGILQVRPDTETIAVVFGTSTVERFWQEEFQRAAAAFAGRVRFTYLDHLPLEGIRAHAAALGPKSAVFYGLLMVDADGVPYNPKEALEQILADAAAPVFTVFESYFGLGTVGGQHIQEHAAGQRAADVALRLLAGQPAGAVEIPAPPAAVPMYDWRALKRWGIGAKRLPPGSLVRFRQPTLWEDYRWPILAVGGVILVQALLIGGLAIQRQRRLRAERDLATSEKRLRMITDALPALITYVDSHQRYRFNNQAYQTWFGFTPQEARGRHIREVLGERYYQTVLPYIERSLAGENLHFTTNIDLGDGRGMVIEAIYVPDRDPQGRVCGIYIMALDVTERTLAQEESKRLQEELFHAGRISTMGELAGALAHEINQPLSAIMSNAQAAQRFLAAPQPDLAEVRAILTDIVEDDARAGEVIRRLRELLKHQGTRRHSLDLNALLGEVARMLHSDAVRRGIDVQLDLAPQLPPIQGDRIQLQQVALNLMLNAYEAMEARPREDRRLVVRTAERGDGVLTAVSDSGSGIPEGDMDRIFKPFYTTKPQGLGMGLSLSRTIVQAHRGRLWAESPPAGGTTFYFNLPVEAGEKPD